MSTTQFDEFVLTTDLIHLITATRTEKGYTFVTVKCGADVEPHPTHEGTHGYTGFNSRVTCEECKWHEQH